MKLFYKALAVLTALLIVLPVLIVKVSAFAVDPLDAIGIETAIYAAFDSGQTYVEVTGANNLTGTVEIYMPNGTTIDWRANTPNLRVELYADDQPAQGLTFNMLGSNCNIGTLYITASFNAPDGLVDVDYYATFGTIIHRAEYSTFLRHYPESPNLGNIDTITGSGMAVLYGIPDPEPLSDSTVPAADPAPAPSTTPAPEVGEIKPAGITVLKNGNTAPPTYTAPTVEITEDKPFEQDGKSYAGTVDIVSIDSDTPQEIPKEVFINGQRYLVGDTVYIVGEEKKKIEATADTGFSYVFTAVENSERPVKFTAEGLPEGLEMSADGTITTKTLPAPVGTFEITVTADNGADTNVYTMTIEIKSEMTDAELLKKLTENDIPELLTEPQEDVRRMWINEELSIHYEPDIDDFYAVFLDGQLLNKQDYRVEEGSTVIILTEQTIAPLPNGDHVVTTMFHQESNVGMDTIINDVGSSSYVFRFGDEKSDNKRINISGDGVEGSVTFDDKNAKETPITTISANTEAIEQRAKNLSNATGREIIAAFETKQHGGFGGKTATFAVSVKSLDLKLKDKTAVYIAVYDSKTGKTYQNKGEIKDGMIVFKTKHSGVFMISLKKF
jgi:hypothetical protein